MTTKDVIKALKKADPKGECSVLIGNHLLDITRIEKKPVIYECGAPHQCVTIT